MAPASLQFRSAKAPDDVAQMQALIQSAFRADDSRHGWTADTTLGLLDKALRSGFSMSTEEIVAKIAKPDSIFLVAIDAATGQLVACFDMVKRSAHVARFATFAVGPEHMRRGIGRQAIAHAEEYCRSVWGVEKLELGALSTRQELIAWYMRCGYRKTGEVTPFPPELLGDVDVPHDFGFVELDKDLDATPVKPQDTARDLA